VDLVGNAGDLADLVPRHRLGTFDYVVSSHNFEHLPNPVAFLQACEKVLKPDGILSMAIPDRRVCFDYFRPHTILTEWLEAFFEDRKAPTPAQVFSQDAYRCYYRSDGRNLTGFSLQHDPGHVIPMETLRQAFDDWNIERNNPNRDYRDTHCSTMTPASFECLIRDLNHLGIIKMSPLEISPANGNEFYAHLRNAAPDSQPSDERHFYDRRRELLHQINDEASENSRRGFDRKPVVEREKPAMDLDQRKKINNLERQLTLLKTSRSWKVTAPLRSVSSLLRRTIQFRFLTSTNKTE
jgi:hypothetical protein